MQTRLGSKARLEALMLDVMFRRRGNDDQLKPLEQQGFFKAFPPPGIEVVSWYVMMGIGQVLTLRVPAERVREVNRAIERTAWGAYRTEFCPTYDFKAVAEELHTKAQ